MTVIMTLRLIQVVLHFLQDLGQALQQNGELRGMAQQLQARLEEEGEVVSALRAQLVDYKLQVRGAILVLVTFTCHCVADG